MYDAMDTWFLCRWFRKLKQQGMYGTGVWIQVFLLVEDHGDICISEEHFEFAEASSIDARNVMVKRRRQYKDQYERAMLTKLPCFSARRIPSIIDAWLSASEKMATLSSLLGFPPSANSKPTLPTAVISAMLAAKPAGQRRQS